MTDNTENLVGYAKVNEVAKYLNISTGMVHKMISSGSIPYRRIGKVYRVPWAWLKSDINFTLNAATVEPVDKSL
jgi:excisionase family DNA binding protein